MAANCSRQAGKQLAAAPPLEWSIAKGDVKLTTPDSDRGVIVNVNAGIDQIALAALKALQIAHYRIVGAFDIDRHLGPIGIQDNLHIGAIGRAKGTVKDQIGLAILSYDTGCSGGGFFLFYGHKLSRGLGDRDGFRGLGILSWNDRSPN
jgi:hypothetical protein